MNKNNSYSNQYNMYWRKKTIITTNMMCAIFFTNKKKALFDDAKYKNIKKKNDKFSLPI